MLEFKLDGDILSVTETMHSFTDTTVNVIQYNIKTWESRVNNDPFRTMTEGAINWVKKYYLPKVMG